MWCKLRLGMRVVYVARFSHTKFVERNLTLCASRRTCNWYDCVGNFLNDTYVTLDSACFC